MAILIDDKQITINDLEAQYYDPEEGWPKWLDDLLDNVLNEHLNDPQVTLVYDSYESFRKDFISTGENKLLLDARKVFHPDLRSGVTITMTGDYIRDFQAAAAKATGIPSGTFGTDGRVHEYVWHHVENPALQQAHNSTCTMELLTQGSHSHPHKGAVYEYRKAFGGYGS
jgi:hypothetical protein